MAPWPDPDPTRAALAAARSGEARQIRAAELPTGSSVSSVRRKSANPDIRQAVATGGVRVLRLDLRSAASEEHMAFMLAREMVNMIAPGHEPPRLAAVRCPPRWSGPAPRLVEILGGGLQEALRRWPSGRFRLPAALESLELLADSQEVLLWVDHLEAPRLSFRHPLKVGPLLWSIAELAERAAGLRLLLSGREAARPEVDGPRAAFEGRVHASSCRRRMHVSGKRSAQLLGIPPAMPRGSLA